jgi:ABC-type antimicrobial peptide transport system permease subunit
MMCWRKFSGFLRVAVTLLTTLWLVPAGVLACPSCNDAVTGDPVASALSWTTLLLIAMPMVLIGSIGGWVFYAYWRAARPGAVVADAAPQPSGITHQPV